MSRPRLLFYCQHSLGLGHLARALRLADAPGRRLRRDPAQRRPVPGRHRAPAGRAGREPAAARPRRRLPAGQPRPGLERGGGAAASAAAPILDVAASARPRRRAGRAVPVRPQEVRVRAAAAAARPRASGPATGRWCCAACATSWSAGAATRPATTNARAGGRTRSSTRCWCTPTRRSPGSRSRSRRRTPLRVPVHYTGFVAPPARSRSATGDRLPQAAGVAPAAAWSGSRWSARPCACTPSSRSGPGSSTTVVAGPFLPEPVWEWLQARGGRLAARSHAVRRVDDLCRRDAAGPRCRSARPATTPRWTSCGPGHRPWWCPFSDGREDEQRAGPDGSRPWARCGWSRRRSSGRTASSTSSSTWPAPRPTRCAST